MRCDYSNWLTSHFRSQPDLIGRFLSYITCLPLGPAKNMSHMSHKSRQLNTRNVVKIVSVVTTAVSDGRWPIEIMRHLLLWSFRIDSPQTKTYNRKTYNTNEMKQ